MDFEYKKSLITREWIATEKVTKISGEGHTQNIAAMNAYFNMHKARVNLLDNQQNDQTGIAELFNQVNTLLVAEWDKNYQDSSLS